MIKINFKMERRFFTAVMLILLLFTLCFITMPVSTAVDNDEDIVVDFHVIQLFQHDEAPGVISVSETITYNNTGDQNYTGTLNVWLHDFMDAYAYIDGMLLDLVALSSNLYSVQIPSNRSIEPHSSFLLNIEYLVNINSSSFKW